MAKQTINIGSAPNDGTGDTARDAFDICNDNFTELYSGSAVAEGTAILSTGEVGGTKFLREDGDGTSSWQAIPAPEGTSVLSTGPVTDGYVLTADGAGGAAWEEASGGGAFSADAQTQITPTTAIVLDEATGDEVALDLSYTVNKATSGNDTGLLINQTDTASPGTSYLIDAQQGGTSRFSVDSAGNVVWGANAKTFGLPSSGEFYIRNSAYIAAFDSSPKGMALASDAALHWSDSTGNFTTRDLYLYRDAANTLALRNGTNAQTFRAYGTDDGTQTNYERLAIGHDGTDATFAYEKGGTGTGGRLLFTNTLDAATGDEVALQLDYTTNKATSGNDTGLLINQTDTASPGTSLLADFQVGGSSKLSVTNGGLIKGPGAGTINIDSSEFKVNPAGANRFTIDAGGSVHTRSIVVGSVDALGFASTSGSSSSTALDTKLYRDAANTLALRNGTNAQTFNVYNTYTDASNYERGFMKWNSNVLEIGTDAAGTGTVRNLKLASYATGTANTTTTIDSGNGATGGTQQVVIAAGGSSALVANNFTLTAVKRIQPQVDGTLNMGSDTNRWANTFTDIATITNYAEIDSGYTVATLPTASVGMIARVTDASSPAVGSTVTGGGAAAALCWYNGSSWTVLGV